MSFIAQDVCSHTSVDPKRLKGPRLRLQGAGRSRSASPAAVQTHTRQALQNKSTTVVSSRSINTCCFMWMWVQFGSEMLLPLVCTVATRYFLFLRVCPTNSPGPGDTRCVRNLKTSVRPIVGTLDFWLRLFLLMVTLFNRLPSRNIKPEQLGQEVSLLQQRQAVAHQHRGEPGSGEAAVSETALRRLGESDRRTDQRQERRQDR